MVFVLVVIISVLCLPAMAASDAVKGADLYAKKCKLCHGVDGAGTPAMQKKYGPELKPLGGAEIQAKKDPELAKGIMGGKNHTTMAKTLQPADVDNVVAHIRTLKK
jgi:mono/diheme cytochrome c family protein